MSKNPGYGDCRDFCLDFLIEGDCACEGCPERDDDDPLDELNSDPWDDAWPWEVAPE